MLRLRSRQLEAIGRARALELFEEEMLAHLPAFAPNDAAILGPAGVRAVVRLGVRRAGGHGLADPGVLRPYVELMLMFGSFFDTDPLLPWASAVLGDASIVDPFARASRLHEQMLWYLEHVAGGPSRALDVAACQGLDKVLIDHTLLEPPRFEGELVGAIFALHPTRAAYLGEPRLHHLVTHAIEVARRELSGTAREASLVAFMMFTLGHGCFADPVMPWASDALVEREQRAKNVERALRAYLLKMHSSIDRA